MMLLPFVQMYLILRAVRVPGYPSTCTRALGYPGYRKVQFRGRGTFRPTFRLLPSKRARTKEEVHCTGYPGNAFGKTAATICTLLSFPPRGVKLRTIKLKLKASSCLFYFLRGEASRDKKHVIMVQKNSRA
eukprot:2629038-Rhodomonas_salina.1